MIDFSQAENEDLNSFKQRRGSKYKQILPSAIGKRLFVPSGGLKKPKTSRRRFFGQSVKVVNLFLNKCRSLQSSHVVFQAILTFV